MKKVFLLFCAVCLFASCKTIDSVSNNEINCKYTLLGAQTTDFSLSSVSMDVAMVITNMSGRNAVKMNKFEGKLYINGAEAGDVAFTSDVVNPGRSVVFKDSINLPFSKIGKNIAGLVTMNSIAVKYRIAGTIYFDTADGEKSYPISVEQETKD